MKFDLETYVVFVSFITSFFAVFLSAGIVLGVPSIASEFGMNNIVQNYLHCPQDRFQENSELKNRFLQVS